METRNNKTISVAIYARYSTSNQRDASIEDQIRECKKYIADRGYLLSPNHIFIDRKRSGQTVDRKELDRLRATAKLKQFEKVVVLNLARLTREMLDLLIVRAELESLGIEIISVQEGIESFDESATVDIHLRGLVNQLNLDTIRRETRRGLVGNIERDFLAGGLGYGYRTVRTGKITLDPNGRPRGEGSIPEVIPEEAEVIRRIYRDFIGGKSITRIVKDLNVECVPTRKGRSWNESTVSKILKSETFTGKYIWGRTSNHRNPITGKKEKRDQPRENWVIKEWASMRIIDDETWAKAQARWNRINGTFPPSGGGASAGRGWPGHRGYSETNAKYLLSGCLKCGKCGGAINVQSGKGDGYYGCQMRKRGCCDVKKLIPRLVIEEAFINQLTRNFLNVETINTIRAAVDSKIKKHFEYLPEQLSSKNRELDQLKVKIANLVSFVADGNRSDSINVAIKQAEERERIVKEEIKNIKAAQAQIPTAPSEESIRQRISNLVEILEKNVAKASELIRDLIGDAKLEVKKDENGRESFDYSAALRALALLSFFSPSGSNFYMNWTGDVGQRTEFHLPLSFTVSTEQTFIHQTISSEAVRLQQLGWSYSKIARELGVTDKTAKKAVERAPKNRRPRN